MSLLIKNTALLLQKLNWEDVKNNYKEEHLKVINKLRPKLPVSIDDLVLIYQRAFEEEIITSGMYNLFNGHNISTLLNPSKYGHTCASIAGAFFAAYEAEHLINVYNPLLIGKRPDKFIESSSHCGVLFQNANLDEANMIVHMFGFKSAKIRAFEAISCDELPTLSTPEIPYHTVYLEDRNDQNNNYYKSSFIDQAKVVIPAIALSLAAYFDNNPLAII